MSGPSEPKPVWVTVVRHGATTWSSTGRHTGWTDIALSDEGRHQAALVAPRLRAGTYAMVLTSTLERARTTCRLAGLGATAQPDPDLREWDYGAYDGLTTAEITRSRPGWSLWADGCPGGEDADAVAARADRVIARCRAATGPVALFAHGHLLRVLAARWLGQAPSLGAHLGLSTAAVGTLGWERQVPVLGRWNDTTHLHPTGAVPSGP